MLLFSCQKEVSTSKESSVFNAAAAKEWYYAEFKKSAEWQGSALKGKKLPEWKSGYIGKIGNSQAVEFPLVTKTKSFPINPVSENRNLSQADIMRINNASISRIVFAKSSTGKIEVREVDYIPDWNYLVKYGFDISKISLLGPNFDFSGRVLIKKWDGSIVSSLIYKDGKIIKTGKRVNGIQPIVESQTCTFMYLCIWQQDCVLTIYGDGMIANECGPWYNTGECWFEEVCNGEIDPCEEFNLVCNPGGNNENPECSMTNAEAQAALQAITTTILENGTDEVGTEIGPDPDGIIKQPILIKQHQMQYNWFAGYSSVYTLFFNAVRYRPENIPTWKWESVNFDKILKTSGGAPPCFSSSVSASASVALSSDKKIATFTAIVTATAEISCLFGAEIRTMVDEISDSYDANRQY